MNKCAGAKTPYVFILNMPNQIQQWFAATGR